MSWGERLGRAETFALADAANRHPPQLRTLDRTGERVDSVEFHPAWHELMRMATAAGEHASPWRDAATGCARRARGDVHAACAGRERHAVPADDDVRGRARAARTRERRTRVAPGCRSSSRSTTIRGRCRSREKRAALIGMGMTERQGGSDVRSNRTRAEAQRRRHVPAHRSQVVLLGTAMRCAPRARAGRRRRAASSCRGSSTTARATRCGSFA